MPSITLFQDVNLAGPSIRVCEAVSLKPVCWDDRVSSLVVGDGSWELVQASQPGGPYLVYANGGPAGDGVYRTPSDWGGMNDAITSLQPV